jgi:RHS Repeat.
VKTTYDGLGRTIKVERGVTATGTQSVVDTEYDVCACSPLGKVKRVSQPYAPGGPVYWTTYHYDALGRLLSVVAPDGSTGTYLYQGRTTKVTDPAGKWKKFTVDVMGHLLQVTEPNPGGGADFETYYTYDALDNLTQVAMPRNGYTQTRTFAYQGRRLVSATNPESGTTTYTYNSDGTPATRTDADNRRQEYTTTSTSG